MAREPSSKLVHQGPQNETAGSEPREVRCFVILWKILRLKGLKKGSEIALRKPLSAIGVSRQTERDTHLKTPT